MEGNMNGTHSVFGRRKEPYTGLGVERDDELNPEQHPTMGRSGV